MKLSVRAGLVVCVLAACASSGRSAASPMDGAAGKATAAAPGFGGDVTVSVTMAGE